MSKIFVSYCNQDSAVAQAFLRLLHDGMKIGSEHIFCTIKKDAISPGDSFSDTIAVNIRNSDIACYLLTENFLNSKYCLMEMGAAWGLNKRNLILMNNMKLIKKLNSTPFYGIQCLCYQDKEELNSLYQIFKEIGLASANRSIFEKECKNFIESIIFLN